MTREIDLTEREAYQRPACSAAHDQALARIRSLLGAFTMPRHTRWWADLTPGERATLVRHAGLHKDRVKVRWPALGVEERQAILTAADRAAAWARNVLKRLA